MLDLAARGRLVARVGGLLVAEPSQTDIDLSPVILNLHGAVALDALMVVQA